MSSPEYLRPTVAPGQPRRIVLAITGSIGAPNFVEFLAAASRYLPPLEIAVLTTHTGKAMLGDEDPCVTLAEAGTITTNDDWAGEPVPHIFLAEWAHAILIMPASANTLAGISFGLGRNIIEDLALSARCPIGLVPNMNPAMWSNPVTQEHYQRLTDRGVAILNPSNGTGLAHEVYDGRSSEAPNGADLVQFVQELLVNK